MADCLDGALLEGCQTGGLFLGSVGLMEDVASATFIVALKVAGGGLSAKVAVDASDINVESAGDILGNATARIRHLRDRSQEKSEEAAIVLRTIPPIISLMGLLPFTQEAVQKTPLNRSTGGSGQPEKWVHNESYLPRSRSTDGVPCW